MAGPSYRQVIQRVWKVAQSALRVVDVGPETLEEVDTNTVTVSTTLLDIDDWFSALSGDEKLAQFQIISGGPINVNSSITKVPTAGGTEGSPQASAGDIVKVQGYINISRFRAILATGGSNAEVRGTLARRAST